MLESTPDQDRRESFGRRDCPREKWVCMGPLAVTISHETLSSTTSQYSVLKFLRNFACNSTVRYARFTDANSTADNKGCCRNQELAPRDPQPPLTVTAAKCAPRSDSKLQQRTGHDLSMPRNDVILLECRDELRTKVVFQLCRWPIGIE